MLILHLQPAHRSDAELRYKAGGQWIGWLTLPLGIVFLGLIVTHEPIEPPYRLIHSCFAIGMIFVSLLAATWRHELVVHLKEGRYTHQRGPRWFLETFTGDLNSYLSVGFYRVSEGSDRSKITPYYEVNLRHHQRPELKVAAIRDLDEAWGEAKKLALAVPCPLEDCRFGVSRPWSIDRLRDHSPGEGDSDLESGDS